MDNAIDFLRAKGVNQPLIIVPGAETARRPKDPNEPPITPIPPDAWSVPDAPGGAPHIVRRRRRGKKIIWVCSPCKQYQKNRARQWCDHIDRVRDEIGERVLVDANGVPFRRAKRRAPVLFYYPEGPTQCARLSKVQRIGPARRKEMARELALLIGDIEKPTGSLVGQPMVQLRVVTYALLRKVHEQATYAELSVILAAEMDNLRALGWMKDQPPCTTTLCQYFASPDLRRALRWLVRRTASVGRRIDSIGAVDATGLSKTMTANYLDQKHRKVKPRKNAEFIKMHAFVGAYTSLICYAVFTLNSGEGVGDPSLLPHLLAGGLSVLENPTMVLADNAYCADDLFELAEEYRVVLVSPFKVTANPNNMKNAQQRAVYDLFTGHFDEEFAEIYRYRTKIEGAFSAVKRTTGPSVHLRTRRSDVIPEYPPQIPRPESARERLAYKRGQEERWHRIMEIVPAFVGMAITNEAYAKCVCHNINQLVRLEVLHDDRVNFAANKAFEPMLIVNWDQIAA